MKYNNKADALLDKVLGAWASLVIRNPLVTLLAIFALTVASGIYTFNNLGVNTDTTGMLSAELPFKQDHNRLSRTFPDDSRAILVVIDGNTPEITSTAVKTLEARFRRESGVVESVFTPNQHAFFERQGLLYFDVEELDRLAMDITRAQPFLGRLSRNDTLDELLNLLNQALDQRDSSIAVHLDPIFEELSKSIQAALDGKQYTVSWQKMMLGGGSEFNQSVGFILVRPHFNYNDFIPAEKSFEAIRSISRDFERNNPDVRVRLTGEVALEHEELQSVSEGTEIAGSVSLILVCISLLVGLRSPKLAVATLLSLVVGLVLSAAFATLSVGHLNLISIAFAVLYIGLGVDYAIHLSLRFEDLLGSSANRSQAAKDSVRFIGPSIILCTATTALGFYAFVPTAYTGVSELGIISGTAMFIGLFVTLTLLPALFVILPLDPERFKKPSDLLPLSWYRFPIRYSSWVRIGTLIVGVFAAWSLAYVTFDFDPISLRDQSSESVKTFRDLLKSKENSPLVISVLAENQQEAIEKTVRLGKLDSVSKVISILDFVPEDQEEKIEILQVLDESLGPVLDHFEKLGSVNVDRGIEEIKKLAEGLESGDSGLGEGGEATRASLSQQLKRLLTTFESADSQRRLNLLDAIQKSMLSNLAQTIGSLSVSLNAEEFYDFREIPDSYVKRWVSPEGVFRLLVFPKKDLNDLENMREFVAEVQKIEPHASDLPVFYAESGREVVKAFQQALAYAVVAIILVSFLVLRNLKETLEVLFPLLLASVLTGASTVLFDNPFNFANIIVLPVLLGLGIDSSIHVVHRLRIMPHQKQDILRTSTARGIFFSGLTTVFSFTSLAFISHAGTASLGLLLTIGIILMLFCTLIVLPAFAVGKSDF